MLSIEEVKERLVDRNRTKVAELSGVKVVNIHRLMNGGNTSYLTMKKLSTYFESQNK